MFEELDEDITPAYVKTVSPFSTEAKAKHDKEIADIITGKDNSRILAIVGPCSAHDPNAVNEYFSKIAEILHELPHVKVVGRVYTDKPRTIVTENTYKGICFEKGFREGVVLARNMMIDCLTHGIPVANELLYPDELDLYDDLVSYWAIGARCSESQGHRLVASGIDVPVGVKNPTDGSIVKMVDGVESIHSGQRFIHRGHPVKTPGNTYAHCILRGGSVPNYHYEDMIKAYEECKKRDLVWPSVIVDCNHANSNKDYKLQRKIAKDIINNKFDSNRLLPFVKGVMIESFIEEGRGTKFGQSITDACLDVESTKILLKQLNDIVHNNLSKIEKGVCHD